MNAIRDILKTLAVSAYQQKNVISNVGLFNGKMGFCINLYEISRFLGDEQMEGWADNLVDEVYAEINDQTPWHFSDGVAGTGWGIEHLVQQGFVAADTDQVLKDTDSRLVLQRTYGNNMNLEIAQGFAGFGLYFVKRLQNKNTDKDELPALLIKQEIVSLVEQLDWFEHLGYHIVKEPEFVTREWFLPVVLDFLCNLYVLDIYNHRVTKILHWMIDNLQENLPEKHFYRLQLLASLREVAGLGGHDRAADLCHRIGQIDNEILLSELESLPSQLLMITLQVLNTYIRLSRQEDTSATQYSIAFWQDAAIKQLNIAGHQCTQMGTASIYGLLNGFSGLYTALPALKNIQPDTVALNIAI